MSGTVFEPAALARLSRFHQTLLDRATGGTADPAFVADIGVAVVFHGALEHHWLLALNPLVDEALADRLRREHDQLADELELLDSLLRANPDSPDIAPLSSALLAKLRIHLARDQRLLYSSSFAAISWARHQDG